MKKTTRRPVIFHSNRSPAGRIWTGSDLLHGSLLPVLGFDMGCLDPPPSRVFLAPCGRGEPASRRRPPKRVFRRADL